ncbi:MAG: hypothetical protein P4L35_15815 [Ignavibacteriaceae bacterium]|nr:hypothetical protein [Ignavibacteriaceae bacterium]
MNQGSIKGLIGVWGLNLLSFMTNKVLALFSLFPLNIEILLQRLSLTLAIIYTTIKIVENIQDRIKKKRITESD